MSGIVATGLVEDMRRTRVTRRRRLRYLDCPDAVRCETREPIRSSAYRTRDLRLEGPPPPAIALATESLAQRIAAWACEFVFGIQISFFVAGHELNPVLPVQVRMGCLRNRIAAVTNTDVHFVLLPHEVKKNPMCEAEESVALMWSGECML